MARFAVRTPITTREPTIVVDAGLPIGRHRFRLEVIDAAGRRSAPDDAVVDVERIIIDPGRIPTPGPIVPTPGPIIPTPGPIRPPRSRTRRKKEKP
jgi:hypothetical protein